MAWWLDVTLTDDRGRPAKVRLDGAIRDDPALASVVSRVVEAGNRAKPETGARATVRRILFAVGMVGGVVVIMIGLGMLASRITGLPPAAVGVLWPLAWVGAFAWRRRRAVRKSAAVLEASLLRIGRCPACGYDLRRVGPGPDRVCTCPECAAAWRAERVGDAEVAEAELSPRPDAPGDARPLGASWLRGLRRTPTIVDGRGRAVAAADLSLTGLEAELGAARAEQVRRRVAEETFTERAGLAAVVFLLGGCVLTGQALSLRTAMASGAWLGLGRAAMLAFLTLL